MPDIQCGANGSLAARAPPQALVSLANTFGEMQWEW